MSRACNPAGTGCNRVQQAWQPHAPEPLGRDRAWQVKKPCDDRFCVDPANPTTRWGDGEDPRVFDHGGMTYVLSNKLNNMSIMNTRRTFTPRN